MADDSRALNEAIAHAESVRDQRGDDACAAQHDQLADWLKELRRLRGGDVDAKIWEARAKDLRAALGLGHLESQIQWDDITDAAAKIKGDADRVRSIYAELREINSKLYWSLHPHCKAAHGLIAAIVSGEEPNAQDAELLEDARKYTKDKQPDPPGMTGRVRIEKEEP